MQRFPRFCSYDSLTAPAQDRPGCGDICDDPSLFRDPDPLNKTGASKYGPVLQEACFGDAPPPAPAEVIASRR